MNKRQTHGLVFDRAVAWEMRKVKNAYYGTIRGRSISSIALALDMTEEEVKQAFPRAIAYKIALNGIHKTDCSDELLAEITNLSLKEVQNLRISGEF